MAPTRYLEIADELTEDLLDVPNGTRLASEHELSARFAVGRSAARAASEELERRGMVRRAKGAGTFVQRPLRFSVRVGGPTAWEQLIRSGAGCASVPSVRSGTLPRAAATAMGVPAGRSGLRLSMKMSSIDQRLGRSSLLAVGTDRAEVTEGLREHHALLRAIDAHSIRLRYRSAHVTLGAAGPELADELGIGVNRLYWKIDGVLVDEIRDLTVWVRTEFRADRITLDLHLGPAGQTTDQPRTNHEEQR